MTLIERTVYELSPKKRGRPRVGPSDVLEKLRRDPDNEFFRKVAKRTFDLLSEFDLVMTAAQRAFCRIEPRDKRKHRLEEEEVAKPSSYYESVRRTRVEHRLKENDVEVESQAFTKALTVADPHKLDDHWYFLLQIFVVNANKVSQGLVRHCCHQQRTLTPSLVTTLTPSETRRHFREKCIENFVKRLRALGQNLPNWRPSTWIRHLEMYRGTMKASRTVELASL